MNADEARLAVALGAAMQVGGGYPVEHYLEVAEVFEAWLTRGQRVQVPSPNPTVRPNLTARRELADALGIETNERPDGVPRWGDLLGIVRSQQP